MQMFRGGGLAGLLRIEEVQQELKLTDAQKEQLTKLEEQRREEMRKRFSEFQGLSDEERRARFEKMREQAAEEAQKRAKETQSQLQKVLKPEQFKRLMQIDLQQQARRGGISLLLREDVGKAIGLSAEQKKQVESLAEATRNQMTKMYEGLRDLSREERGKRMEENRQKLEQMRTAAQKKAMGLLEAGQKEKLRAMMGKPFKMPERTGTFGRGGARPGGEGEGRRRPGGEGEGGRRPRGGR
jgi:hypothetical protein